MQEIIVGRFETPAGIFGAAITPRGLARLTFPQEPFANCEQWARRWEPEAPRTDHGPALDHLQAQLTAYFRGALRVFDVPLDMRGTPFQLEVWRALVAIPFGVTHSYGQVAAAIGRPKAVRAVGAANGANPVPIIVPCHRVIGSNGTLTGYGGGLPLKQQLLELEGIACPPVQSRLY